MPDLSFTAESVIAIAAGSSVIAACVTQGLTALRDNLKTRRDGTFSALYLAAQLESYASLCSTHLGEAENHSRFDGQVGTPHGNVPDLPTYSEEIDWKTLGITTTDSALSFRVEIESTQAMITDAWDVVGDEDAVLPTAFEEMARLGQKALKLASNLRAKWKIPPVEYQNSSWNVKVHLADRLTHFENLRAERDDLNRKSWADMEAVSKATVASAPEP